MMAVLRLLLLTMASRVFLPLRCVDMHCVDRTPCASGAGPAPRTVLRLAFRQLSRHLGVTRPLTLGSDIATWHECSMKGVPCGRCTSHATNYVHGFSKLGAGLARIEPTIVQ